MPRWTEMGGSADTRRPGRSFKYLAGCGKTMSRAMSTKKPDLQDFGVTPEEYNEYQYARGGGDLRGSPLGCLVGLIGLLIAFLIALAVTRDLGAALGWGILGGGLPSLLVAGLVDEAFFSKFKRSRLLASPVASQIKLYEDALAAYQEAEREAERQRRRKLHDYWMSLDGDEFEQELGTLYRYLGYRVESTPSSGDQGVDLILRKNGKTTVVQCKSHQAPVGPAVARELLGSLVASGADNAILACIGGFTRGVKEFVRGKRIALVSASDLATLGGSVEGKTQDITNSPPVCPVPGCGNEMVPREGRHGRFWGCPKYPRCRGTRRGS